VNDLRTFAFLLSLSATVACHRKDEAAFTALQTRGQTAMGVDQYTSSHRFEPLTDGGRIELQRDVEDSLGVAQIRRHLQGITVAFKAGHFDIPMFVHATSVPGTAVMAARRDAFDYTYGDLPRGGEVRITSRDSVAVAAIHDFLAFQRMDHHTN
jgi:hypothetical protein